MSYVEKVRIAKDVHSALKQNSEVSIAQQINDAMRDLIEGKVSLEDAHREEVLTSFYTDHELVDQVKAIAKSKGLTFTKALAILLQKKTHH